MSTDRVGTHDRHQPERRLAHLPCRTSLCSAAEGLSARHRLNVAAFVHSPLQAPYTASKAGVWAMSDSVRLEVRHHGVDVGTIHPTFFKTR